MPGLFCSPEPKNIFLLGYGAGITAHSILLDPRVSRLTVAELEPAVIDASAYFEPYFAQVFVPPGKQFTLNNNASTLSHFDKRLQINCGDGRCFLSMLNTQYEAIVSQPGEPSRSSSAYLYTLEFWQLAKSRLRPGGIFCQWLPLYAIDQRSLISLCHTFATVFPRTYVFKLNQAGELILLGKNGNDQLSAQSVPAFKQIFPRMDISNLQEIMSTLRMTPESFQSWLNKYEPDNKQALLLNRDDCPFIQYRLQSLLIKKGIRLTKILNK